MDYGQQETERILKNIEKRINHEYAVAMREIEDELSVYFAKFEKKDETWRRWVANGERTKEEYQQWRIGQMAVGRRWADQKDAIARQLVDTSKTALSYVRKYSPEIYAENFNYSTYQVEHMAGINTPFTLWSKVSVNNLVEKNPDIAPPVGKKLAAEIAEGKAIKWNKQQLQSVMMQGILQGDSIPKLATRLATKMADKDRKASIRNARTLATGVQNVGRVDSYKRAQDMGVDLEQMWMATLDGRTRHSHRWLDGEVRPVGEQFSNGLEYPADPHGDASEVYNCRCSLRGVVKGLQPKARQYRDNSAVDGMSYDEWRNAKATSGKITAQDEAARIAKQNALKEYANGKNATPHINNFTGEENLSDKLKEAYEYHRINNSLELTPYMDGYGFTSVNLNKLSEESAQSIGNTISKLIDEFDTPLRHVRTLEDEQEKLYAISNGVWAFTAHDYRMGDAVIVINEGKCKNYEKMVENLRDARDKMKCVKFVDGKEGEYIATHEFAHSIFNVGEPLPTPKDNWTKADFSKIKEMRTQTEQIFSDYKKDLKEAEKKWMEVETEATKTFDLRKWDEAAKLREEYDKLFISKYALTDVDEFMAEAFAASRVGQVQNKYTEAIADMLKENYGK